jgi:DNA-binding transcriptional MerR regulator
VGPQAVPQKLYYRVGDVAEIVGVKPHVLRYWETEFGFLPSQKDEGNERLYTQKDLQKVLTIKRLLVEDRCSVASAKKRFREEWAKTKEGDGREERRRLLRQAQAEVEALVKLLG